MTFWAGYVAGRDDETGALAPGRFADFVVWEANPLAIHGPDGMTLEEVGRAPRAEDDTARLATVNAFIERFRPRLTVVGGVPVYRRE